MVFDKQLNTIVHVLRILNSIADYLQLSLGRDSDKSSLMSVARKFHVCRTGDYSQEDIHGLGCSTYWDPLIVTFASCHALNP